MFICRSKNVIQAMARTVALIIYFLLIYLFFDDSKINGDYLSLIILVITICEIVMLLYNKKIKNSGILMMFYLYNAMCVNGFVIAYFFDKNYVNFKSVTSMAYVYNPYYYKAIIIANIVLLTFVFSTEVFKNTFVYEETTYINNASDIECGSKVADIIGLGLLCVGTFFLAYVIITNGLMFSVYTDVLSTTSEIPLMQHGVILTSLAVALLFSAGTIQGVKRGVFVYVITMLLHFSIGNRGEVLYAAVICFALYSVRFKTIKARHILIAGIAVVVFIPLVRIMREGKIDAYTFNPFSSFLDVLCEEGFQISSFTYIVQYIHTKHSFVWGMTYINDFADFIMRRFGAISPWSGTEAYVIKRIMPYDGMGFSMIAELYYNFTLAGACVAYGIFAQFMRRLDNAIYRNELTNSKRIIFSMLMVEMINLSRNDASTLPVYICYGLILYFMYKFMESMVRR